MQWTRSRAVGVFGLGDFVDNYKSIILFRPGRWAPNFKRLIADWLILTKMSCVFIGQFLNSYWVTLLSSRGWKTKLTLVIWPRSMILWHGSRILTGVIFILWKNEKTYTSRFFLFILKKRLTLFPFYDYLRFIYRFWLLLLN